MNTLTRGLGVGFGLGLLAATLTAQDVVVPPSSATVDGQPAAPTAAAGANERLSAESLQQLVAPVALYPDALVAVILPASTYSSDIVLASRYLEADGDPAQLDAQPWDESVQALARYPEVVKWMDENLAWTQQLGDAYLAQPADLMAAIQRGRANARANGTLVDTPQQRVIVDATGNISIVPAQPEVIYVPRYAPEIVYGPTPVTYALPPIDFGFGFRVGSWLVYECDWGQRVVWVGDRHRWRPHDWHRPPPSRRPDPGWHAWHPQPSRPHPAPHPRRPVPGAWDPHHGVVRPRPYPGSPPVPARSPEHRERDPDRDRGPRPPVPMRPTPPPPPRALPPMAPPVQTPMAPPVQTPRPGPSLEPGRPGSTPTPRVVAPPPAAPPARTGGGDQADRHAPRPANPERQPER